MTGELAPSAPIYRADELRVSVLVLRKDRKGGLTSNLARILRVRPDLLFRKFKTGHPPSTLSIASTRFPSSSSILLFPGRSRAHSSILRSAARCRLRFSTMVDMLARRGRIAAAKAASQSSPPLPFEAGAGVERIGDWNSMRAFERPSQT